MERPNFSKIFHDTVGVGIAEVRASLANPQISELRGQERFTSVIPPYIGQLAGAKSDLIEERYGRIKDKEAAKRFGTKDLDEYSYWAWRSCGIAGVQMIIKAYEGAEFNKTTMGLVQEGLDLGGYDVKNDVGWYHDALKKLANKHNVPASLHKFIPSNELALRINNNQYVLASINSDFGGHLLLLYGFRVNNGGQLEGFITHDPNDFSRRGEAKFINKLTFDELSTRRAIICPAPKS